MPDSTNTKLDTHSDSRLVDEGRLLNELLDQAMIATALLGLAILVLTHLRAMEVGWGVRDVIQIAVELLVAACAIFRKRIRLSLKKALVIVVSLVVGVSGVATLGTFTGAVFFIPMSAILSALFFNGRALQVYALFCIATLVAVATGFISGFLFVENAAVLVANPMNWGIYLIAFTILIVFTCTAVYRYRQALYGMMAHLGRQHDELKVRTQELEKALGEIQTLKGIIPICSYCHKIRDEEGAWDQLEKYISTHSNAQFSHGVCPDCSPHLDHEVAKL